MRHLLEARRRRVRGVGVNVLPPDKRPDVGGKNRPRTWPTSDPLPRRPSLSKQCSKRSRRLRAAAWCIWRNGFAPLVDSSTLPQLERTKFRMVDRADNLLAEGRLGVDAQAVSAA
ncbi:MAG: hypothetical protein ACLT98_05000 [Eggerthellaceae bacterium]